MKFEVLYVCNLVLLLNMIFVVFCQWVTRRKRKVLGGNPCCGAMATIDYRNVALNLFLHNLCCPWKEQ